MSSNNFKVYDNLSIEGIGKKNNEFYINLYQKRIRYYTKFSNNSLKICSKEIQVNISSLSKICSICFEKIPFEKQHYLHCGHVYHCECINKWLNTTYYCPICRQYPEGNCLNNYSNLFSRENVYIRNNNNINSQNEFSNFLEDIILIILISSCILISIFKLVIFKSNFK